jgi:hypothetical protein
MTRAAPSGARHRHGPQRRPLSGREGGPRHRSGAEDVTTREALRSMPRGTPHGGSVGRVLYHSGDEVRARTVATTHLLGSVAESHAGGTTLVLDVGPPAAFADHLRSARHRAASRVGSVTRSGAAPCDTSPSIARGLPAEAARPSERSRCVSRPRTVVRIRAPASATTPMHPPTTPTTRHMGVEATASALGGGATDESRSPVWRGSSRALAHAISAFLTVSQCSLKTRARRMRSMGVGRRQTLTLDARSQSPTHTATTRT